jgi:hypothetical protein
LFRLLSPIQEWKRVMLGDPDAPDSGDPDFDGLDNLVEYGLGLIPTQSDPSAGIDPLITTYAEGDRLAVVVPRNPMNSDITVVVESSADLMNPWTMLATSHHGLPFFGPGYVGGDSPTPGLKSVEIRDLTNLQSGTRRFIRVRVNH